MHAFPGSARVATCWKASSNCAMFLVSITRWKSAESRRSQTQLAAGEFPAFDQVSFRKVRHVARQIAREVPYP
jgi:hypothetical protein